MAKQRHQPRAREVAIEDQPTVGGQCVEVLDEHWRSPYTGSDGVKRSNNSMPGRGRPKAKGYFRASGRPAATNVTR